MKTSPRPKKVTAPKQELPGFNEAESPLFRLFNRRDANGRAAIDQLQFVAGEKLRRDYEMAQFERRTTSSWQQAVDHGRHATISDNHVASLLDSAIDARKRVHAAFDAVGPELAGILYYVCCLAAGLEQAERRLNYPQRSGKAILALALTRLARHYKLVRPTSSAKESPSILQWALSDYRPEIIASRDVQVPSNPDDEPQL